MPASDAQRLGPYRTATRLFSGRGVDVFIAIKDGDASGREATVACLAQATQADVDAATDAARAEVDHPLPHTAPLIEAFERAGTLHVVARHPGGARVDALLATREGEPWPADIAVAVIAQYAETLHASHERSGGAAAGPRPWSIRLTRAGEIVVTHLGLPAIIRGALVGASALELASFQSPESLRGETADRRSDVFSLGVMLAHLLTGSAPFTGTADAIEAAVALGEVTPPSLLVGGLPEVFDEIVARATAPNPADRYPTADAFQRALLEAAYPTVRVATAADLRAFLSSHADAAMDWELQTVPRVNAVGPRPAPAPIHEEGELDWGEDEETNIWREGDAEEVTVVVSRDVMHASGAAPSAEDKARASAIARGTAEATPAPAPVPAAAPLPAPTPQRTPAPTREPASAPKPVAAHPAPSEPRPPALTGSGSAPVVARGDARFPIVQFGAIALAAVALIALTLRFGCGGGADTGRLEIAIAPSDGTYSVQVDDAPARTGQRSPVAIDAVQPGTRTVTVSRDGFEPFTRTVEVRAGEATPLVAELFPEGEPAGTPVAEPVVVTPKPAIGEAATASDTALTTARTAAREAATALELAAQEAEAREAEARERERMAAAERAAAATPPPSRPAAAPARAPAPRTPVATPRRQAPATPPPSAAPMAEAAADNAEPGLLNIQSVPAARVSINGTDTGRYTPIIGMQLAPGSYRVRLVNEDFGLDREYSIRLESGRTRTVLNAPQ